MNSSHHRFDINRDHIRLLQAMRRFVMDEFNVDVRISEEDAPFILLEHAERSRNRVLYEMGKELREFITPKTATIPMQQYYRGVAVEEIATKNDRKTAKTSVRVYRDQPVRD